MIDVRVAKSDSAERIRRAPIAELRTEGAKHAASLPGGSPAFDVSSLSGERLTAFVEGLILASYTFKAITDTTPEPTIVTLTGVTAESRPYLAAGRQNAQATAWARDLANMPAAMKNPEWLAAQARSLSRHGVKVTARNERWLTANDFGGILAVGAGSPSAPRLIEAAYEPEKPVSPRQHLVLVGKGITFDTGGLNLKPGDSMKTMQTDMSGAAAVLAAMRLIAQRKLPVRVTALIPSAENSFGATSYRPSDVVRHYGGRTSEIGNTDAEGRIVLADAMAYAATTLRPTLLVDVATLTGAMKSALGLRIGGLFATDDRLAKDFLAAGEAAGEPLWRMPIVEDYIDTLSSDVADANNSPGNPGAITAALFLRPFVADVPWVHLDIAGPARSSKADGWISKGATGYGARLLANYVQTCALSSG
ncbi:MAG TPA: leucyl aminopeptidase family protein [Jatrophihabitans sp.]